MLKTVGILAMSSFLLSHVQNIKPVIVEYVLHMHDDILSSRTTERRANTCSVAQAWVVIAWQVCQVGHLHKPRSQIWKLENNKSASLQHSCQFPNKSQQFICLCPWTYKSKVKVKFTLEQATKAQRGSRGIPLSTTSALNGGGWSMPCPGCFYLKNDPVSVV
jgi:hypothetical protein